MLWLLALLVMVACTHARPPARPTPPPATATTTAFDEECERIRREAPPMPEELVSGTTGAISDIVHDPFGRPQPGAVVVVAVGDEVRSATTDEEGWFVIGSLPPGPTKIWIHVGKELEERELRVDAGQNRDFAGLPGTWGPPRGIQFCGTSTLEGSYAAR